MDGNVAGWWQRVSRDYLFSYRQNHRIFAERKKNVMFQMSAVWLIKMRNILAMPNYCVCKHLPALNLKQQQLPFLFQPLHFLLSLWGKVQRVPAGPLFNPGANTHSDESGRQGELNAFFQRFAFGKLSRKEIFSFPSLLLQVNFVLWNFLSNEQCRFKERKMLFQSTSFRQTYLMWTQGPQTLRYVGMVIISWQKNISSKHSLSARPLEQVLESQLLPGDGAFVYLCMWKATGSCTQYGYYRTGLLKMQPGGLMIWIIGCLTEVLASGLAIIFLQMWSFVSLWPNVIWWNEPEWLAGA